MLKDYILHANCCDLFYEDGTSQRIYYYADSGRMLRVKKIHPVTRKEIEHLGVIVGKLYDETIMVLHNQLTLNYAEIVTCRNFDRQHEPDELFTETRLDSYTLLSQALKKAVNRQPYTPLKPAEERSPARPDRENRS